MKIVNKIFSLLVLTLVCSSCEHHKEKEYYIDYDIDRIIYKVAVGNGAHNLYTDNFGKNYVLLNKELYIGDVIFNGANKYKEALSHLKKYPNLNRNVQQITSISILNNDLKYVKVFSFSDPVFFDLDSGTFSETNLKIKVDQGPIWSKNNLKQCLKIEFTQPDNGSGYKKWILNYAYEGEEWVLITRERINNIQNDEDKFGYCIDSINSNITPQHSKHFYITSDLLYGINCNN